jgi:hypothetical protein
MSLSIFKKKSSVAKVQYEYFYHRPDLELDPFYEASFIEGIRLEGLPAQGRDLRFWQLIQHFLSVRHLEGEIAEAGCLRGLSLYLLCKYEARANNGFKGEGVHAFDSFLGFKRINQKDRQSNGGLNRFLTQLESKIVSGSMEINDPKDFVNNPLFLAFKKTTAEFPEISVNAGWIPYTFKTQPERKYKFVHIDVDLYEPIYDSLSFFYPQLAKGGKIVIDDYLFKDWPGAKKATDQFCQENGIYLTAMSCGSAVIQKL